MTQIHNTQDIVKSAIIEQQEIEWDQFIFVRIFEKWIESSTRQSKGQTEEESRRHISRIMGIKDTRNYLAILTRSMEVPEPISLWDHKRKEEQ